MLNNQNIEQLVTEIKNKCDRTSQYYGRLLEWHSDFVNHYGIRLSDKYLFSTGEYPAVISTAKHSLVFLIK